MNAVALRAAAQTWHTYRAEAIDPARLATTVEIFWVDLTRVPVEIALTLTPDERARADRFVRYDIRRRFVAARGVLRTILAAFVERDAVRASEPLRFGYGPFGKPFVIDDPTLEFNLSHCADAALIAVTRTGPVGVDIEQRRTIDDLIGVARLVCDERELARLAACSEASREERFYEIWTRNEARIKAAGNSLAAAIDPREKSLAHAADSTQMSPAQAKTTWQIDMLPEIAGHTAALARASATSALRCWSWPPVGWEMPALHSRLAVRS